jgi:hypothetical protein
LSLYALVKLCLFEHILGSHSCCRRYRNRAPTMAIGLTDHIWSWEEVLTFGDTTAIKGSDYRTLSISFKEKVLVEGLTAL